MTLTDERKILDSKIKANQAQYDLDREAATISALSSSELKKYEYLTGEDLWYERGVLEKIKFEYFPLGKVFDKRLDESDKKEGILKGSKNNWFFERLWYASWLVKRSSNQQNKHKLCKNNC